MIIIEFLNRILCKHFENTHWHIIIYWVNVGYRKRDNQTSSLVPDVITSCVQKYCTDHNKDTHAVGSIFLHQCGIWTLTKKLESSVDVFQRLFLRRVVGIRYPKNITNQELYKITKQIPWSETCKKRRLTLFGHTNRLPYGAPSREALLECLKPIKRPVGGQKLTLIKLIRNDFQTVGETFDERF